LALNNQMLKGDMAMKKLLIPIQFIMVIGCLVINGYAEQPKEKITNSLGMDFVLIVSFQRKVDRLKVQDRDGFRL
jgi:hypothetical protein